MWFESILSHALGESANLSAIQDLERTVSYGELSRRARQISSRLMACGVREGDRVVVLSSNSAGFFEAVIGIALAGAVSVPVNHRLPASQLEELFLSARPAAAIGDRELLDSLSGSDVKPPCILEIGATFTDMDASLPDVSGTNIGMLLYSSATTGHSKAIAIPHRAINAVIRSWLSSAPSGRSSVTYLHAPPIFHSTVTIPIAYLFASDQIVLCGEFTPQAFVDAGSRTEATHAYLVPTMIEFLVDYFANSNARLPALREVFHGGAPMEPSRIERGARELGCSLRNCYGQAEAGGPVTLVPREDAPSPGSLDVDLEYGYVGQALEGFELRTMDANGRETNPGQLGELEIRSESLMAGYWRDPERSDKALNNGWLRSGDYARIDTKGGITIVDRKADTIIRGGQNVYPSEVEAVLYEHPYIDGVAVIGVGDDKYSEVPVAVAAPSAQMPPSEPTDEILAATTGTLAGYQRPTDLFLVNHLPRNATGKILRRVLREQIEQKMDSTGLGR